MSRCSQRFPGKGCESMGPPALCRPWPSSISGWKDKPGLHIIPLSPWNCPGPGAPAALTRKISGSPETGGMCQITTTAFPHQPVTLVPPSQQALPVDNGLVPPWDHAQGQSVSFPQKDPQLGGEGITLGAQYTGTQSPLSASFFPTLASPAGRGRLGPSLRVPGVLWDSFPGEERGKKNIRRATQERWIRSLGGEDPLEEEMATHSRILGQRSLASCSPWGRKESD